MITSEALCTGQWHINLTENGLAFSGRFIQVIQHSAFVTLTDHSSSISVQRSSFQRPLAIRFYTTDITELSIMNNEDQELLSKISEISGKSQAIARTTKLTIQGRINRHKNGASPKPQPWNKYVASADDAGKTSHRSAPYPQPSTRTSRPSSSRHRTLVINNSGNTSSAEENSDGLRSTGWVTKRDRHVQLINKNILEQETQARSKAIEETRKQKALSRDQREQQKIKNFLQCGKSSSAQVSTSAAHEITIDGLRFRVLKGGSKLARLRGEKASAVVVQKVGLGNTDDTDSGVPTPKEANVGGVPFLRSKNGNLYRSGIIKAKRYQQSRLPAQKTNRTRSLGVAKKINERCKRFTLTGILLPSNPGTQSPYN